MQHPLLQRAIALLREGSYDQAEPVLRTLLQRWPGQPDALHFLGVLAHRQGRSDHAVDLIRTAIAAAPTAAAAPLNNLGNVLVESQRYNEATEAYRECLALQPDQTDALANLATLLRRQGALDESEALCRRALALKPDFPLAWFNLSLTLLEKGQIDNGLAAHSRAVALWPRHLEARNAVPKALARLGRLDDAARLYREWLATDPDNPVIHHHLAACVGGEVPARASDAYVEKTFDAFAGSFDANLSALHYRAPERIGQLLQTLLPAPAAQYEVHDLGCGTGLCGPQLRAWARELSGCDLSQGMLEKGRRRQVYDSLHHAELVNHLTAHPRRWDLLVCADTLCYFGDLHTALGAAAAALRAGGLLVFTVEDWAVDTTASYHLQPHGRYAHHLAYVRRTLVQAGLQERAMQAEALRTEAGAPVMGWLVAAARPD